MVNLTQKFVAKVPAENRDYYDSGVRGLVLRTRVSGRHSYLVRLGRRWFTIGVADPDIWPVEKARGKARSILGQAADGKDPIAEKKKKHAATLQEFLEGDYRRWALANLKRGQEAVDRLVRAFPIELRRKRLPELNAFTVERWRTGRHSDGVKPVTTNRDLDALRAVLSKAVAWGLLAEHPLRHVKRAKVDAIGRVRYLSADEETRLRAALEDREAKRRAGRERFNAWRADRGYPTLPPYGTYVDHLKPIILLALNTGLRRGELFNLTWADVDLARALLTVKAETAKTGRTRYPPLNTEAVAVLKVWHAQRDGSGLVFPGPDGKPMRDIKTAWLRIARAAKLADFTFHDLRHSFASKLVMAGVDLNTVRELLGHRDIQMTLRYAHLAPQKTAAAVEKLVAAG